MINKQLISFRDRKSVNILEIRYFPIVAIKKRYDKKIISDNKIIFNLKKEKNLKKKQNK